MFIRFVKNLLPWIFFPVLISIGLLHIQAHQSFVPQFVWPVEINPQLSGTFGELRSNHFHAGIDIKSPTGAIGLPILAAAKGHIYRIKIKAGGYGNALYIRHEGGFSTVYAHLDQFDSAVMNYVRAEQYKRKSYEVDLYPSSDLFPIDQGQIIGEMGNSGYSFGPHLHFEIRNQEIPVNPLKYLSFEDHTAPKLREIYVHYLDAHADHRPYRTFDVKKIRGDTIALPGSKVGFSAWAYDPHNEGLNKNGVYRMKLKREGESIFSQAFNAVPFSLSRYANACMNYQLKKLEKKLAYRLHHLPGNLYRRDIQAVDQGELSLEDDPKRIDIEVEDINGNVERVHFWVKREGAVQPSRAPYHYVIPFDEETKIKWNQWELNFSKNTVYADVYTHFNREADHYFLGEETVPFHKYFDVSISQNEVLSPQHHLTFCNKEGKEYNVGGTVEGRRYRTKIRDFGEYVFRVDSIPPSIDVLEWSINGDRVEAKWKIDDNIDVKGKGRALQAEGTLDGRWTLIQKDAKTGFLTWEEKLSEGEHFLRIRVRDDRNNEKIWKKNFKI